MGQIVGGAAKPKRCNLNNLSQLGTPAAGEHILVSYDNSMNAAGQGNFDRYIVGDGRTAATALELKYLDDSTRPYIVEEVNRAVADIQPIEITGDVTNAPDEEDLTSENQGGTDVLKFKDKAYNSALYSGLGRVYLRKNIVTLEGTGKNVLTQAMMNTTSTIYHIQYDYDLNGQTITIPAGCVLEFEGGSISDVAGTGKIVFADTKVNGDAKILCDYEGTIDGMVQGQWFGLVPNDNTFDNSPIIEKVCNTFAQVTIAGGKYYCSTPITISTNYSRIYIYSDLEYTQRDTSDIFITITGSLLFIRITGAIYGATQNIASDNVLELSTGIQFEDCNGLDVFIKDVRYFHTNIRLYGKDNGRGCSYSKYIFDYLVAAKVLIELKSEGTGWVTSNTIRCNRMTSFGGYTPVDTAILIGGDHVGYSDNVFEKVAIEGVSTSEPVKIYGANYVYFKNIRNENNYQIFAYAENSKQIHFQSNYGDINVRTKAGDACSIFDDDVALVPYKPFADAIRLPAGNARHILFNAVDPSKAQNVNYGPMTYTPIGFIIPITYKPALFSCKDVFTLTIVYYDANLNIITRDASIFPAGSVTFKNSSRVNNGMETTSEVNYLSVCLPTLTGVSYVGYFFSIISTAKGRDRVNPIFNCDRVLLDSMVRTFFTIDTFKRYPKSGTTAQRPVITENWRSYVVGFEYFDTDLGKPIYAKAFDSSGNGTWVDATGTAV